MYHIRPHHLMCIQNYIGRGYSEEFTAHMNELIASLTDDTGLIINEGCDDVCSACPYNEQGRCTSLDKVAGMDAGVMDACGLTYGESVRWGDISSSVREKIFTTDRFEAVCRDCQWFSLCSHILEKN